MEVVLSLWRDAPHPDLSQIRVKLPMLAVCYGAQYLAHFSGGEVAASILENMVELILY
jgi:GMP synthase-like glutamine amidotransferase